MATTAFRDDQAWRLQLRRIWGSAAVVARATGSEKDDLVRGLLRERYGKESLKELEGRELVELMGWLSNQARRLQQASEDVAGQAERARGGALAQPATRTERQRRPLTQERARKLAQDDYIPEGVPRPFLHRRATPEQMQALDDLRKALGWSMVRYRAFCMRQVSVPWPQTRRQAATVHEGLEAMLQRVWPADRAAASCRALLSGGDLTAWERTFLDDILHRLFERKPLNFSRLIKLQEISSKRGERTGV